MNKTQPRIWFLVLLIALLAIPSMVVFAKELGMLTISGPGIKGEVTLTDHDEMMKLEGSGLFDQVSFVKPPENLREGYNMTAHLNLDGKLVPAVQMIYYPAEEGQSGYIHYTGRLNGESLQAVDDWAQLSPNAESALLNIMTANKITIQPAAFVAQAVAAPAIESAKSEEQTAVQPASAPSASPSTVQTPYIWAILIAAILAIAAGGLFLRRRTVGQRSA